MQYALLCAGKAAEAQGRCTERELFGTSQKPLAGTEQSSSHEQPPHGALHFRSDGSSSGDGDRRSGAASVPVQEAGFGTLHPHNSEVLRLSYLPLLF